MALVPAESINKVKLLDKQEDKAQMRKSVHVSHACSKLNCYCLATIPFGKDCEGEQK